ncbi:glycosylated lysosomal membrane protein-like isoform X2 [Belonocnema kinseyi]|uniref:glycosylated lysosomal membrane protein-like isoform X2 n=1 Tax=Belonocnema kinseyi TaxID=2817044 RepID=UPI00143D531F|nr:glycosylated lysosomal membrane protein-like isoform X2 [Belonocnema kinseyi]
MMEVRILRRTFFLILLVQTCYSVTRKIIEFNDINDTGYMKSYNSSYVNILNPSFFKWRVQSSNKSDQDFELEMLGDSYFDPNTNIKRNGNIKFMANVFGSVKRFMKEPSMLHSENSTQIDLTIDKFETNSTFSKSRFAVEILLVSDGNINSSLPVSETSTLDDQYAPGVFKVMKLKTPLMKLPFREENVGMYLEWRPISYTSNTRVVTDSTEVKHYKTEKSLEPTLDIISTILYPYYSQIPGKNLSEFIVQKFNVSFGSKGDSFYDKDHGYASWTFLAGYSSPLDEQISSLTILIISIVVALPVVPILLYGSLIFYRRITKTDNEFQNF